VKQISTELPTQEATGKSVNCFGWSGSAIHSDQHASKPDRQTTKRPESPKISTPIRKRAARWSAAQGKFRSLKEQMHGRQSKSKSILEEIALARGEVHETVTSRGASEPIVRVDLVTGLMFARANCPRKTAAETPLSPKSLISKDVTSDMKITEAYSEVIKEENKNIQDYAAMKVADLRKELKKRGASTTGWKAVLVERLEQLDNPAMVDEPVEKAELAVSTGYSAMKVSELRDELTHRNADVTGLKYQLVERLENLDNGVAIFNIKKLKLSKEKLNPESLSVMEIRKHLQKRGVESKGVRTVIVKRLTREINRECPMTPIKENVECVDSRIQSTTHIAPASKPIAATSDKQHEMFLRKYEKWGPSY